MLGRFELETDGFASLDEEGGENTTLTLLLVLEKGSRAYINIIIYKPATCYILNRTRHKKIPYPGSCCKCSILLADLFDQSLDSLSYYVQHVH